MDCDTYDTDRLFLGLGESQAQLQDVPYLDVSAMYKDNGEVYICVVNRHQTEAMTTDLICQTGTFSGEFEVYEVNGPDIKAGNDFDGEKVSTQRRGDLSVGNGKTTTYTFPAHSFTMLKGKVAY